MLTLCAALIVGACGGDEGAASAGEPATNTGAEAEQRGGVGAGFAAAPAVLVDGGFRDLLSRLPLAASNGFRLQYTNYAQANAAAGISDTSRLTRLQGQEADVVSAFYHFDPFPWFGGEMLWYLSLAPELLVLYEGLDAAVGASWEGGLLIHVGLGAFERDVVDETLTVLGYDRRELGEAVYLSVTNFQPGTLTQEYLPLYGLDLRDVVVGDGYVLLVREPVDGLPTFAGGASLANHAALSVFAAELDALPVFGAQLEDTREGGYFHPRATREETGAVEPLERYEALALATGRDAEDLFALALLWFGSAGEAEASVATIESNYALARSVPLRGPFSEQFDLVQVTVEGQLVRVFLRPTMASRGDPGLFARMGFGDDLSFIATE